MSVHSAVLIEKNMDCLITNIQSYKGATDLQYK